MPMTFAFRISAMCHLVSLVFCLRAVAQIVEIVISRIAIKMANRLSVWAWPDKRQKHESMDKLILSATNVKRNHLVAAAVRVKLETPPGRRHFPLTSR